MKKMFNIREMLIRITVRELGREFIGQECLLCEHENLSSNPQLLHKKLGVALQF